MRTFAFIAAFCFVEQALGSARIPLSDEPLAFSDIVEIARPEIGAPIESHNTTQWLKSRGETRSHGIKRSRRWYRAQLCVAEDGVEEWFLVNRWPLSKSMSVWKSATMTGPLTLVAMSDNSLPVDSRPVDHHRWMIPVSLTQGQCQWLFVEIKYSSIGIAPLELVPQRSFLRNDAKYSILEGIYFGVVLVMLLYNLAICIGVRDPDYFYYVVFMASFGLLQAHFWGYTAYFLWPDAPEFNERALGGLIGLAISSGAVFVARFLRSEQAHPRLTQALRIFGAAAFGTSVLAVIGDHAIAVAMGALISIPTCTLALYLGIQRYRDGYTPARYFVIAWTLFLSGVVIYSLQKFGLFAYSGWNEHLITFGNMVEMTLLSMALAQRINESRLREELAQRERLTMMEERDEVRNKNMMQKVLLAEAAEKQAVTEKALREEAEARVEIFSAVVHHLNNPLNHIQGARQTLGDDIELVNSSIQSMLEGPDDDTEVRAARAFFTEQFDSARSNISILAQASTRAEDTVKVLRAISGIDGTSFGATKLREVVAWLERRAMGALQFVELAFDDDCLDTRLVGHPALYAQALELLIVTMTQEEDVSLRVHLMEERQSDEDGDYRLLELRPSSPDQWTIHPKVMTAVRMLLKPYACPIKVGTDFVRVGLLETRRNLRDAELMDRRGAH